MGVEESFKLGSANEEKVDSGGLHSACLSIVCLEKCPAAGWPGGRSFFNGPKPKNAVARFPEGGAEEQVEKSINFPTPLVLRHAPVLSAPCRRRLGKSE